jgi:mannose-6-phosphate isomerase
VGGRADGALAVLDRFASPVHKVEKPWGHELVWAATDAYAGKLLFVRAGEELSLQYHREKDETIYVHEGRLEFEIGEEAGAVASDVAGPGAAFHLRPGTVHRMRALEDSLLLEVSTSQLDDVVRLEDRYGRAT